MRIEKRHEIIVHRPHHRPDREGFDDIATGVGETIGEAAADALDTLMSRGWRISSALDSGLCVPIMREERRGQICVSVRVAE